jgi:hypothetical protein
MRAAEPLDCAVGGRPSVESDEIEMTVYIAEQRAPADAASGRPRRGALSVMRIQGLEFVEYGVDPFFDF